MTASERKFVQLGTEGSYEVACAAPYVTEHAILVVDARAGASAQDLGRALASVSGARSRVLMRGVARQVVQDAIDAGVLVRSDLTEFYHWDDDADGIVQLQP